MNNTINIAEARLQDLSEILALQKKAYQTEAAIYNDYTIPPLHQTMDSVEIEFRQGHMFKAVASDGRIVGSIRLVVKGDTAYIGKLIVDENYRNHGLGKKLLAVAETLVGDKVKRYELFTGFRSEKNLHIYTHAGYKEFKREQVNDGLTMIFLEKVV